MNAIRTILLVAALLGLGAGPASAETSPSLTEKAALQAAMQRHIDRTLVDGAILHLDRASGEVQRLHPVTAHPMILIYGEHFVLCFDFRDDAGNNVPIDYYMARQGGSYTVFHTAVADRALLQDLMAAGKVTR
ncbi:MULTISPECIES: hypothetical protein [Thalassobaculum]|uniref:Uncharacterized protein n=1 Tax=Thalassobaculum litoreum DSM 18839 TaxID=1123362 RepID=A0A8G2BH22_9PROT|nr:MULTISPECIES: hypothetical protein [Thalassobaculum]SDF65775.1 hypothetical protein SAMN05660686_01947 [Thalassobaculum litoreum DSM 18839]